MPKQNLRRFLVVLLLTGTLTGCSQDRDETVSSSTSTTMSDPQEILLSNVETFAISYIDQAVSARPELTTTVSYQTLADCVVARSQDSARGFWISQRSRPGTTTPGADTLLSETMTMVQSQIEAILMWCGTNQ